MGKPQVVTPAAFHRTSAKEARPMQSKNTTRGVKSSAPGGYGTVSAKGYRRVMCPDQHRYRMEHVLVWEAANGRPVPAGHCIHHRNEEKLDNRIENLEAVTHLDHKRMHSPNYRRDAAGEWEKRCPDCEVWMLPTREHFHFQKGYPLPRCKPCWVRRVVREKQERRANRIERAGGLKAETAEHVDQMELFG